MRFSLDGPAQDKLIPSGIKWSTNYLGSLLTDSFDKRAEIPGRLADYIATTNRMKLFEQKANTTIRWKLQVLNAITRSKLLYDLECVQLTKADISKLNAFQNKALRILGKPPIFLGRQAPNENLFREIRAHYKYHFEYFGKSWKYTKFRAFRYILISPQTDNMK